VRGLLPAWACNVLGKRRAVGAVTVYGVQRQQAYSAAQNRTVGKSHGGDMVSR
jgi:hypothetical protein